VLPLLDGTGDGVVCRLFGLLPVQEKRLKDFQQNILMHTNTYCRCQIRKQRL